MVLISTEYHMPTSVIDYTVVFSMVHLANQKLESTQYSR